MFFDPRELLMLAVLIGVTGWVLKGLMITWHRVHRSGEPQSRKFEEMEERLRKIEAATSSLLVDVSAMREKQRFMAKLQATGAEQRAIAAAAERSSDTGISPMDTQSIPIIPRMGSR
jgi:hypothetical protein